MHACMTMELVVEKQPNMIWEKMGLIMTLSTAHVFFIGSKPINKTAQAIVRACDLVTNFVTTHVDGVYHMLV